MKWHNPWAFSLFIFLILLLASRALGGGKKASLQFSTLQFFQQMGPGLRARLQPMVSLFKWAALGFAIVALARPQEANTKINRNVEGIDIMFAMDVSDSMLIEDMDPENRLEASKSVIRKFIQARTSDRMGLVVFAAEAFTRCPLTLDYPVLLESLDTVATDSLKQGTAIGTALASAVSRIKDSTARSRVIILLTDGESNSGIIDPESALEVAKGFGIKVYTIGVGRSGPSQLPVYTESFGRKIKTYQPITSRVNEDLLQRIADESGGKFYRAGDTDSLRKVFKDIDRLEKSKIQVQQFTRYNELFEKWAYLAFILYAVSFVLGRTWLRRAP
ncbi:MAG: VWA domain-containing protein [Oligoflexia bacterium]|nr:VWA domain-containing protein [Oligoflexia bacterium]